MPWFEEDMWEPLHPPVDGHIENVIVHNETEKGICVSGILSQADRGAEDGYPRYVELKNKWLPKAHTSISDDDGVAHMTVRAWLAEKLVAELPEVPAPEPAKKLRTREVVSPEIEALGKLAHRSYTTALGREWSEKLWAKLSKKEQQAWFAARVATPPVDHDDNEIPF